jgi:hypothetical protein
MRPVRFIFSSCTHFLNLSIIHEQVLAVSSTCLIGLGYLFLPSTHQTVKIWTPYNKSKYIFKKIKETHELTVQLSTKLEICVWTFRLGVYQQFKLWKCSEKSEVFRENLAYSYYCIFQIQAKSNTSFRRKSCRLLPVQYIREEVVWSF